MTLSIGKTLSISKTIAPALLVGTASAAALVYAFTNIPHGAKVDSGAVGVMSQPAQPESGAGSAKSAAIGSNKAAATTEAPPALASTQSKVADLSAQLGGAPPLPAADPSLPAFDVARVEAGGDAVIAGRAPPGAAVDLMRGGEKLDHAVADASGQFVMVPPHLPAGSYELSLSAKLPDGTVALSKQGVTITVQEADASTGSLAPRAEAAPPAAAPVAKPQEAAAPPRQAMAAASATDDGTATPKSSSAAGSTRVVTRGDSLWRISRIAYGAGEQYAIVYRANRDRIRDPNLIHPGQVLVVPLRHR
ncbi:MAG TPA: LysM peptidoglycan-binding domain-containing protein [Bradyrhizobium sp.]|nr:LysM peptidoglycan-binding domain-containing protein [Bradyrhizobium sp.]